MIAFDIEIDDEKVLLAGVEDWSILALNVSGVRNAPPGEELRFVMGGLTEADVDGVSHHVRWGDRPLKVGSKLTVTIVNTDEPDEPMRRYRSDHEVQESPFTEEETRQLRYETYLELKAISNLGIRPHNPRLRPY